MSLALWKKIQEDDLEAFDEFYHQYVDALYRYGISITKQEDIVNDSLQIIFTKLYQKRHSISIKSSPKSYLMTSLRRMIIEQLDQLNSFEDINFEAGLEFAEDSVENKLIAEDQKSEMIDKLNKARNTLSKRQKEVIYLKFEQELNYDEISKVMNITKDAAYKLVNQSLKRLTENF